MPAKKIPEFTYHVIIERDGKEFAKLTTKNHSIFIQGQVEPEVEEFINLVKFKINKFAEEAARKQLEISTEQRIKGFCERLQKYIENGYQPNACPD